MKFFPGTNVTSLIVASFLGASLAACGGSSQHADTAEAIDDADDAQAEVEEERHEEDLEATEEAAEAREDSYD